MHELEYRRYHGLSGIVVDSNGRIYSEKPSGEKVPQKVYKDYRGKPIVFLSRYGWDKVNSVAHVVAGAWLQAPSYDRTTEALIVKHKDRRKGNHPDNLFYKVVPRREK